MIIVLAKQRLLWVKNKSLKYVLVVDSPKKNRLISTIKVSEASKEIFLDFHA